MAHTISHKAKAPVKANPGTPATGKEALMRLLERTGDIVADLHEDFLDVYEMLEPEPRPLPPTIDPNVLFMRLELREEKLALNKAAEALGREVEDFRQAARRLRLKLPAGRNARAWEKLTGWLDEEARLRVEAVDNAIRALLWHTRLVAALVTFAQADNLPESIEEGAGNE